jgi:hypothetical protein
MEDRTNTTLPALPRGGQLLLHLLLQQAMRRLPCHACTHPASSFRLSSMNSRLSRLKDARRLARYGQQYFSAQVLRHRSLRGVPENVRIGESQRAASVHRAVDGTTEFVLTTSIPRHLRSLHLSCKPVCLSQCLHARVNVAAQTVTAVHVPTQKVPLVTRQSMPWTKFIKAHHARYIFHRQLCHGRLVALSVFHMQLEVQSSDLFPHRYELHLLRRWATVKPRQCCQLLHGGRDRH